VWDFLVLNPMVNLLLFFYQLFGQQTIIAIAVLTVLVRLIILPLTIKQQQSAQRMQELQPELQKLQKKYAQDKEKLAQEQMKFYQEAGMNPLGGCLPLLVQFPIMIGLYQGIIRALAVTPLDLLRLSQNVGTVFGLTIPGLASLIPLQSTFLWLDLGQPDPYFVLPLLVMATSWLSQKILTAPTMATDERSATMNQQMQIMMPLMFGFISITYASGLSIYFIISNLVTMVQYFFIRRDQNKGQEKKEKEAELQLLWRAKDKVIPPLGHFQKEWSKACKGDLKTSCNFDYAGTMIEMMLLGLVAYRAGEKLAYDGAKGCVTNSAKGNDLLKRKYRDGWVLNG